jgi:hypothetical protein
MRFLPVAALILSSALLAQNAGDVVGWGNIAWGITVAQAKTIYGSEASLTINAPPPVAPEVFIERVRIDHQKLEGTELSVSVQTRPGSDAIEAIRLTPTAAANRAKTYASLLDTLGAKYGDPVAQTDKPNGPELIKTSVWSFRSSIITLRWTENKAADTGSILLSYVATKAGMSDE